MSDGRKAPGWIGAAVDFGPLVAFFAAYEIAGLQTATMPAMTAVIVGVLGGLTLYLNDPDFIKMKPTIVYLLFASIVAVELFSGRPLLVRALTAAMPPLNDMGKRALLIRFLVFFLLMAAINEGARRLLSTDHWVLWKVFGGIGATFLFIIAQVPLIQRHKLPEEKPAD